MSISLDNTHKNFLQPFVNPKMPGIQKIDKHTLKTFLASQKQPIEVFFKKAVLKNFAIFTGKHQRKTIS